MKTTNGEKYVLQLFKHWSYKPGATLDESQRAIVFEGGNRVVFDVQGDSLDVNANVGPTGDLEHCKTEVESHLKRFAFRENVQLVW